MQCSDGSIWRLGVVLVFGTLGCSGLDTGRSGLGGETAHLGRRDQAKVERLRHEAAKLAPDQATTYHRLAVLADQRGSAAEAMEYYRQAYRLNPESAALLNDLGYSYLRRGQLQQSEQSLRLAIDKDPSSARAINNLALALGLQGRLAESLQTSRMVVPDAEAHANLGYVLAQRGDIASAQQYYQIALSLRPDLVVASDALAAIAQNRQTPLASGPILQAAGYEGWH